MPLPPPLQSTLDPHGPDAREIAEITWVLIGGAGVILALVVVLSAWAVFGRGQRRGAWLGSHAAVVGGGIVLPVVVLSALLVYTFIAAARMPAAHAEPALRIEVIGELWWWRVRYMDGDASGGHTNGGIDFETANELRLPVGRSVELHLRSDNVLHSFWVPALAGKLDLIPGRVNRLTVRADQAGHFRGQCAEYCGTQHAQMALWVVATPPADFDRWRAAQRAPAAAAPPAAFMQHCASCHAVRGSAAAGVLGPDLTHVGSRLTLAAGALPNHVGAHAAWIADPQQVKPGSLMPAFARELDGRQLTALAGYLRALE